MITLFYDSLTQTILHVETVDLTRKSLIGVAQRLELFGGMTY